MDFSFVLFIVTVVTGVITYGYQRLERKRAANGAKANANLENEHSDYQTGGVNTPPMPLIVEYSRALFPVILFVFVLRSFVIEPFRIPSGSMLPSLYIGDFILVNKYTYGIRLPLINQKVIPLNVPERGDVMVFRYPRDPKVNFIKRVIGLPGDTIAYKDKRLFVNGEQVARSAEGDFEFTQKNLLGTSAEHHRETIDEATYSILIDENLHGRDMEVTVPEKSYFVMGDNRDHSNDSRYWRFVPEDHIVGKAFFIWFSWKSASGGGVYWDRIGNRID